MGISGYWATRVLSNAVFLGCKLDSTEPEQHPKVCVSLLLPLPITCPPSQCNPKTAEVLRVEGTVVSRWGDSKEAGFK